MPGAISLQTRWTSFWVRAPERRERVGLSLCFRRRMLADQFAHIPQQTLG